MSLDGWTPFMFLAVLAMAAIVIVTVTLIVRWTMRQADKRNRNEGPGS